MLPSFTNEESQSDVKCFEVAIIFLLITSDSFQLEIGDGRTSFICPFPWFTEAVIWALTLDAVLVLLGGCPGLEGLELGGARQPPGPSLLRRTLSLWGGQNTLQLAFLGGTNA